MRNKRGQQISGNLEAELINDLRVMRDEWRGSRTTGQLQGRFPQLPGNQIWVKNRTTETIREWCPIAIVSEAFSQEQLEENQNSRVLNGSSPRNVGTGGYAQDSVDGQRRWGITQEAIEPDGFGRVAIAGTTPAWVRTVNQLHDCADVENGNASELVSDWRGRAQLLHGSTTPVAGRNLCNIFLGDYMQPPEIMYTNSGLTGLSSSVWTDMANDDEYGYVRYCEFANEGMKLRTLTVTPPKVLLHITANIAFTSDATGMAFLGRIVFRRSGADTVLATSNSQHSITTSSVITLTAVTTLSVAEDQILTQGRASATTSGTFWRAQTLGLTITPIQTERTIP